MTAVSGPVTNERAVILLIGIDPGTTTGVCVWDAKAWQILLITSGSILEMIELVRERVRTITAAGDHALVVVEDARKRRRFDKMDLEQEKYGAAVREGAGSIKRDSAIWEEFLKASGIPYEMRQPRGTKQKAEEFERLTGYTKRTNTHERDATNAVFGLNEPIARVKLLAFQDGGVNAGTRPTNRAGRTRSAVRRRYRFA